jgi:hypothetical protein
MLSCGPLSSARLLYVLQALVWTTLNGVLQALVAHR